MPSKHPSRMDRGTPNRFHAQNESPTGIELRQEREYYFATGGGRVFVEVATYKLSGQSSRMGKFLRSCLWIRSFDVRGVRRRWRTKVASRKKKGKKNPVHARAGYVYARACTAEIRGLFTSNI